MIPVESEQETLNVIHDLSACGFSLRKIVAELESLGRKPRSGMCWHPQVVSAILKEAA